MTASTFTPPLTPEQHADLINRREVEAKRIATARHRLGQRHAPVVGREDRELADLIVKAGLILCRFYDGVVDGRDYPAE